ncbi:Thermophilic serine proteinase precursor [compost metagenome]
MARRMTHRVGIGALLALFALSGCGVTGGSPLSTGGASQGANDTSMMAARKAGRVQKDAVLVKLKNLADAEAVAKAHGLEVSRRINGIQLVELRTTAKAPAADWLDVTLRKLGADSRVAFAEPNLSLRLKSSASDELPSNVALEGGSGEDPLRRLQYSLDAMKVEQAWQTTRGDKKIVVAVIDSGVDAKHKDLKANLSADAYDAFSDRKGLDAASPEMVSRLGGRFASLGHGTHVAGIIGAVAGNKVGISGVAPNCTMMPIKIFPGLSLKPDPRFAGQDQESVIAGVVAQGIVYATDHGAQIINMSLGFPHESQALAAAVQYALQKNVTVLVAAGNERLEGSPINTLANQPGVIGVGATDEDDRVTFFSNAGKYVSIAAPGSRVLSTMPSLFNGMVSKPYQYMDGTSMACPNAAGVAALVKSVKPNLSPAQVKDILEKSADDRGPAGYDTDYGHGRVNAERAVALAKAM